ncbi:PEP-CTERM sorting domain-containing protein [Luteolibacter sp. SL250]|uniref:PEP-CTERM sorting domain-containing protein n=1 Tax=Luteolibacter sp. SL250 TaxID=2995170 RepID=UPI00226F22B8|nr:PEP-CTERM sorting domain-containing protein [Luteolibacter sp. SL250]WAC18499.1 PEP-CTERM sorting domain-containing protein [Luteolibacter sp. SL250]
MRFFTLFASVALAAPASAALLAYEGFGSGYNLGTGATTRDYPTDHLSGQGSGTGSGFTSGWVKDPTYFSASGVYWVDDGGTASASGYVRADGGQASYSTLATTAGQATYQTDAGSPNRLSYQRNFTTGTFAPTSVFVSTLVTIDGSGGVSFGFMTTNGSDNRPFQFGINQSGNLFARGNGGTNTVIGSTVYGAGTYFLVAQIQNDSTNNDTIRLWINPSLDGVGTADFVFNAASAGNAPNFYVSENNSYQSRGLVLDFNSNGLVAGSTSVDEIRIGTTLQDVGVIPEPSAALLLLAGGCLSGLRRRR